MVVHAASGSLITFATMFWGFWAIKIEVINAAMENKISGKSPTALSNGSGLHDYAGISTALIAVPLMITGFIPYFRRWQADKGATTLMRLRDLHKVSRKYHLSVHIVPKLRRYHSRCLRRCFWSQELQPKPKKKPVPQSLIRTFSSILCSMVSYGDTTLDVHQNLRRLH